jgi:hypothetical protein
MVLRGVRMGVENDHAAPARVSKGSAAFHGGAETPAQATIFLFATSSKRSRIFPRLTVTSNLSVTCHRRGA